MIPDGYNLIQLLLIGAALIIVGIWVLAHLFLHSKPTPIDSFDGLLARLQAGQPTVIYFYSNF